jgi:hypothetical protein
MMFLVYQAAAPVRMRLVVLAAALAQGFVIVLPMMEDVFHY